MSEDNSTPSAPSGKSAKPQKPRPDFPLFPHDAGVWAKKIRGNLHYFGPWDDPDGALAKYLEQKDDLHAGRTPRPAVEGVTVKDAVNSFLNHKKARLEAGELSPRSWDDYKATTDLLISRFGKSRLVEDLRAEDFAALRNYLTKSVGPVRLGNTIQRVRSVFKHAFDAELIDRTVRFGLGFKRPSKKVLRIHRAEAGQKLFTAEDVRRLIDAAGVPIRAMILLGINGGFGNADCGNLPLSAVDLEAGWIDYPRPKTGMPRRCPLWPETVQAIREALAKRPAPKKAEDAGLVFITKRGLCWAKDTRDNPLSKETAKLLKSLGINGRKGLGFYTIRHTFRTVADESKDQPAVDFVMGHEVPHMSAVYRETISDDRLRAVADHVRRWLFDEVPARREPFAWTPIAQPAAGSATTRDYVPPLSANEQRVRLEYGLGKANYKQVVLATRLMAKGWREPYYYRGCVWMCLPNPKQGKPRRESVGDVLGKAIRITKTGRVLRGW